MVEYAGEAIRSLSMEERMTICNMTIEWGARAGLIAPDETTFDVPRGARARAGGRCLGARTRGLAHAALRPGRRVRHPARRGRDGARPAGDLGHEPRHGRAGRRHRARSRLVRRRQRSHRRRAGARVHGSQARPADRRDRDRPRLHRLVHELADRRPARGGRDRRGPHDRPARHRPRRARLGDRASPGRGGGSRPGLPSTQASSGGSRAARCASG